MGRGHIAERPQVVKRVKSLKGGVSKASQVRFASGRIHASSDEGPAEPQEIDVIEVGPEKDPEVFIFQGFRRDPAILQRQPRRLDSKPSDPAHGPGVLDIRLGHRVGPYPAHGTNRRGLLAYGPPEGLATRSDGGDDA
jgi:hypothetical protein